MYKNPYAIRPGEKLTRQEALNRYFDWSLFCAAQKVNSKKEACDDDLWGYHLCCEDHVNLRNEIRAFIDYFYHLEMVSPDSLLSVHDLIKAIKKHHLTVDLKKFRQYTVSLRPGALEALLLKEIPWLSE